MASANRPFAYNPTRAPITGADTLDDLAIGAADQDYSGNPGLAGLVWWMGPGEDLGYVIAAPVPAGNHPTFGGKGGIGTVHFWRSADLTEQSFVDLVNHLSRESFEFGTDAAEWCNFNGMWCSYA